ncbi:MAG: hypothetical protein GY769_25255, partial [bacterium]|nr:hypothetical protein [bacterium]
FLSAGEEEEAGPLLDKEPVGGSESLDQLLSEAFSDARGGQGGNGDELLDTLEGDLEIDPLDMLESDEASEQLGAASGIWNWMTGKDRSELLYEALKKLVSNKDFRLDHTDEMCERVTEHVSGYDVICTGHTHFEKAIQLAGGRQYFNSGTWVPLIKLTDSMMQSSDTFRRVYEIFSACRSVKEFEHEQNLFDGVSLLLERPAVVEIVNRNGAATAGLKHVQRSGNGVRLVDPR